MIQDIKLPGASRTKTSPFRGCCEPGGIAEGEGEKEGWEVSGCSDLVIKSNISNLNADLSPGRY